MENLISLVIPTFNSSNHILEFLDGILSLQKKIPQIQEVILIEDGSSDNTKELLKKFSNHPLITIINHNKNEGQHPSTIDGILKAKGPYILTCDDDVSFENINIADLLKKLETSDLVYLANRQMISNTLRFLVIRSALKLIAPNTKSPKVGSSQRFFRKDRLKIIVEKKEVHHYFEGLLLNNKIKFDYLEVPYKKMNSIHRYNFYSRAKLIILSIYYYNFSLVLFLILITCFILLFILF